MGLMRISAFDAFIIALSGFAVVFAVLAVIYLIIILISKILAVSDNKTVDKEKIKSERLSENKDVSYGGKVALIGVDEKTAACIMAIVSHETGIPLSELVFKKIKAI